MRPLCPRQVWHSRRSYRRVLFLYGEDARRYVCYANPRGRGRHCLVATFRRWARTSQARCAQRYRRRTVVLQ